MKLETQQIVARNLRILRAHCAVSQTRFAVDLGLSRVTYSGYETGKVTPDPELLYKISQRCGIKMNDLFTVQREDFIAIIEGLYYYDDNLARIAEIYEKLSFFTKGMLTERAIQLYEQQTITEKNKAALLERKNQMKNNSK